MRRATPGWHSGDCASFVMRNYQGFESLTRLQRLIQQTYFFIHHVRVRKERVLPILRLRDRLEVKVSRPITYRRNPRWVQFPLPLPVSCAFTKHFGGGNGRKVIPIQLRHVNCKHYSFWNTKSSHRLECFLGSSNYKRIYPKHVLLIGD